MLQFSQMEQLGLKVSYAPVRPVGSASVGANEEFALCDNLYLQHCAPVQYCVLSSWIDRLEDLSRDPLPFESSVQYAELSVMNPTRPISPAAFVRRQSARGMTCEGGDIASPEDMLRARTIQPPPSVICITSAPR